MKIIILFCLFFLLFIGFTVLFSTINNPAVLFQLIFTFIYSTFNNNFLVSAKLAVSKHALSHILKFKIVT